MRDHRDDPRYTPTPTSSTTAKQNNALVIPKTLKTSLNSQIVLSEEAYTKALSDIIKRDFFPDLKKADDLSYDINNWVGNKAADEETDSQHIEYDYSRMSLEQFQSKFTSEDNASFSYLLHKANLKRRERYAWAYNAELLANQRRIESGDRLSRQIEDVSSILADGEKRLLESNIGVNDISDFGGEGNEQALVRREKAINQQVQLGLEKAPKEGMSLVPSSSKDVRKAGVDTWGFTATNNLMFNPDTNTPNYLALVDKEAENRQNRVTNYAATRMSNDDDDNMSSSMASTAQINAAVNATSSTSSDAGSSTPHIGGYKFVESMPSPRAHQLPSSSINSMMVSGTLSGTPRRLDEVDEYDNCRYYAYKTIQVLKLPSAGDFKIPKISRRDRLGHQLASHVKTKQTPAQSTPTSRTPRGVSLSPAGHALLEKTKRRRTNAEATPSSFRSVRQSPDIRRKDKGWTPTPQR